MFSGYEAKMKISQTSSDNHHANHVFWKNTELRRPSGRSFFGTFILHGVPG
jgi:hypothetical protein